MDHAETNTRDEPREDRGYWERLSRLTQLKLIVPLRRSRNSPEHAARGVAVGMFWAMTPLVGIQMYLCLMTWLAVKPWKNLSFSLVIACAWTWVTNVFTMLPIYYGFYVTGQIMRGHWDDITGYAKFLDSWDAAFTADAGFLEQTTELLGMLVRELGFSMAIGCLPYAVFWAWVGYVLSLKFVRRRHRRREERLKQQA